MTGSARIIRGNALQLPLADGTVDLVVTSPPYFGLRSYQDGGAHYAGQIGSEATPTEFVDALIAATAEMVRVLKPSGSIWVNLGDKYAGSRMDGSNDNGSSGTMATKHRAIPLGQNQGRKASTGGIPIKSLMMVPARYAIRCVDELGMILRAEVIWSKPNGLPESVTDRVRRSHETWFHFTKQPRYFSAVDEIREPHLYPNDTRHLRSSGYDSGMTASINSPLNLLGKLPGSVWTIPTQPLQVPASLGIDHFAAFPMEWPRRIIRGWSPSGICTECCEGRRPVVAKPGLVRGDNNPHSRDGSRALSTLDGGQTMWEARMSQPDYIAGEACGCPDAVAAARPATVLDPFGGTGTTALVAKALGRDGISVDMSADYCRLAEWRTTDRGQLAAALQVEKPQEVHPDQLALFGEIVA